MVKKLFIFMLSLVLCFGVLAGCGNGNGGEKPVDPYTDITVNETDRTISMDDYMDKLKGALVGTMVGVSYGYPYEFHYRDYKYPTNTWKASTIENAFDQDDIYLSFAAVEVLEKHGIDVSSRQAGIDLYNKNFEFWDGSNNNVLIEGWAPPFSGYPKRGLYTTQPWPDSCSYMCGGAFSGLVSPGALSQANYLAEKFAEIVCYGDGIYGTQFVGAMFAEAFFETDVMKIIEAGLSALPVDSWTKLCVEDVIENWEDGMTAQENCNAIHTKWVNDPYYNWAVWPYSNDGSVGSGILLDSKACAAFIALGLLYGEGDIDASMKYTVACGSDTDSNAAQTVGILAAMKGGFSNLDTVYSSGINKDYKIKYTPYTFDGAVSAHRRVMEANVAAMGGKVGYLDGVLTIAIPAEAQSATTGAFQNSKTPDAMEPEVYTDAEMDQMRVLSDPGFEQQPGNRNGGNLQNDWYSNAGGKLKTEKYSTDTHEGLVRVAITNDTSSFLSLYKRADVRANTDYVFSVWLKTEGSIGADAVKITVETSNGESVIKGTEAGRMADWTKVEFAFNTGSRTAVMLRVGYAGGEGQKLMIDDFGLFVKQ